MIFYRIVAAACTAVLVTAACVPVVPTFSVQTAQYSAAYDNVQSAEIDIRVPFETASITALDTDNHNLLQADVEYIGEMIFNVTGGENRRIELSEDTQSRNYTDDEILEWSIGIQPGVPLNLGLSVSSGEMNADLREFQLTALDLDVSSGEMTVQLPTSDAAVESQINVSSGSLNLTIPTGANIVMSSIGLSSGDVNITAADDAIFNLSSIDVSSGALEITTGANIGFTSDVEISSGSVELTVDESTGVQVNALDVSSGSVNIPVGYDFSNPGDDEEGTYTSPNFDNAETQIIINLSLSSGSFTLN